MQIMISCTLSLLAQLRLNLVQLSPSLFNISVLFTPCVHVLLFDLFPQNFLDKFSRPSPQNWPNMKWAPQNFMYWQERNCFVQIVKLDSVQIVLYWVMILFYSADTFIILEAQLQKQAWIFNVLKTHYCKSKFSIQLDSVILKCCYTNVTCMNSLFRVCWSSLNCYIYLWFKVYNITDFCSKLWGPCSLFPQV